jgi:hypothetical protein
MKKVVLIPFLVAAVGLCGIGTASAGLLLLSGDSNIGNAIDGSGGASVNGDNQTFFENLLGDSTSVLIQQETSNSAALDSSVAAINSLYNSFAGVTSSIVDGTVTIDGALGGVDLYIGVLPSNDYTGAEVAALSAHLAAGGDVLLTGENSQNYAAENARINALLAALGSPMSLGGDSIDLGFHTTGFVEVDPLTLGMESFTYAYGSSVNGGTPLFRYASNRDAVIVAYEETSEMPEPTTLLLLLSGSLGLGLIRNRRHRN